MKRRAVDIDVAWLDTSSREAYLPGVVEEIGLFTALALDAFGAAYLAGYQAGDPQVNAAQAAPGSVFVAKVVPSIDERLFEPSGPIRLREGPVKVCAMIRPRTPRRQPHSTVNLLERLVADYGSDVEVTTFGCGAPSSPFS